MRSVFLLCVAMLAVSNAARTADAPHGRTLAAVAPNDNRVPAGQLVRDTLHVRLVLQMAEWYPDGAKGAHVSVETFSEEGKAPVIPAPLLRVPTGTVLEVTVRNALADSAVHVAGLWSHPGDSKDTLEVAAGASRTVRFAAGDPGTYMYGARIGQQSELRADGEHETAFGAFIVDPPGPRPADRVFVMNIWSDTARNALGINGVSWPSTERLQATSGDTLRWRFINATARSHPMHLHGFYFTVLSRGTASTDDSFAPDQRLEVVTNNMTRYTTMAMEWSPTRPGNWLFHCHIGAHVTPESAALERPGADDHSAHSGDATEHMRGLILGIHVNPRRGERPEARIGTRTLRLEVQEAAPRPNGTPRFRYVLGADSAVPWRAGGPVLLLRRGQPADVNIVNHLHENTAIHWHGLELESWSDGVAGWSGMGGAVASAIAPADSFTARLSVPRAGTFIYHTHLGDARQMRGGLYGPLIVLPEGQEFDPTLDHIFVAGGGGQGDVQGFVVNGDLTESRPLLLRAGTTHRMRFIGINLSNSISWELVQDSAVARWRPIAKDGADLQASLQREVSARMLTSVGETRDFLFTPPAPGEYVLRAASGAADKWSQKIVVRP